ncbi:MAG: hypothetical protein CMG66_00690 [Candidatus Marinimicrobia bacterium]|nr:hypothetical protein [Candidatus Neomarinimicrobiota bacterium]|tara:strand:+ start:13116 stop:14138 length:1023 start_codon:yes stop_codon:yes gene_type:complete
MAELIIVFREVLEAALIIGILYTYLKKSNNESNIKLLWNGVLLAIILSVICSFLFQKFAGGFTGNAGKIFEGIVMIIASAVLASMIIWMAKNKNITQDLKDKAEKSLNSKFGLGIFSLSFIAVFREGVETILFLYGITIKQGGISIGSSLFGGFLALIAGYAIFIQGRKMPIKKFFNITSILLIFVASGMLAYGVHELESAKVIPYFSGKVEKIKKTNDDNNDNVEFYLLRATRINGFSKDFDIDKGEKAKKWASRIWDINPNLLETNIKSQEECPIDYKWIEAKGICYSYPLLHDKGRIGQLVKGFFGYNGDPSLIEFVIWLLSILGFSYLWRNATNKN